MKHVTMSASDGALGVRLLLERKHMRAVIVVAILASIGVWMGPPNLSFFDKVNLKRKKVRSWNVSK